MIKAPPACTLIAFETSFNPICYISLVAHLLRTTKLPTFSRVAADLSSHSLYDTVFVHATVDKHLDNVSFVFNLDLR